MKAINGKTKEELEKTIDELEQEVFELTEEYQKGDRDDYPPDWYDSYVFPLECELMEAKDALTVLDSLNEDSEDNN